MRLAIMWLFIPARTKILLCCAFRRACPRLGWSRMANGSRCGWSRANGRTAASIGLRLPASAPKALVILLTSVLETERQVRFSHNSDLPYFHIGVYMKSVLRNGNLVERHIK